MTQSVCVTGPVGVGRAMRPRRRAWPVALAAALLLGGCQMFSWLPWVNGDKKDDDDDKDRDEPAELVDFAAEADVERVWRAKVGRGLGRNQVRLLPLAIADRLYAADGYGLVVALDRFTGKQIWSARVGEPQGRPFYKFWDRRDPAFVTGGVGGGDGRILIGTTRGELIALAVGDGTELWRTEVSSEVLAPPASAAGAVFAQTADGRLVALEAADGSRRWAFDSQVPLLTLRGTATPLVVGELVFAGFGDGNVAAIAHANGAPVWQQRIMLPQGRTELDRLVDVDGTPVLAGGLLFAASYQGKLKAMRPNDGGAVWELEASTFLDLAEGYGQIYYVAANDEVAAVSQASAAVAWRQAGLKNRRLTSPLAYGNYVVVGDEEGYLHVLAQSDGRFVARRKLSAGLRTRPLQVDNTVYVLANDGQLEALRIRRRR